MDILQKRRRTLTVVFVLITALLFSAAVIGAYILSRYEAGYFYLNLEIYALYAAIFCIPLWDVYVSMRFFLCSPKTKLLTFFNAFALFSVAAFIFEIIMLFWDPFSLGWLHWLWFGGENDTGWMLDWFFPVVRWLNVLFRIVYLVIFFFGSMKKTEISS